MTGKLQEIEKKWKSQWKSIRIVGGVLVIIIAVILALVFRAKLKEITIGPIKLEILTTTSTSTATPTSTKTPAPSSTPSPTPTGTPTCTSTPTDTPTSTPTFTPTPTETPTYTPTFTPTPTDTPTETSTPHEPFKVIITDIRLGKDRFQVGETASIYVHTQNAGEAGSADIGVTLLGINGYLCNLAWQNWAYGPGEQKTFTFNYTVPPNAPFGSYDVMAASWENCIGNPSGQCVQDEGCNGQQHKVRGVNLFQVVP